MMVSARATVLVYRACVQIFRDDGRFGLVCIVDHCLILSGDVLAAFTGAAAPGSHTSQGWAREGRYSN
jgi:hypothetical protein